MRRRPAVGAGSHGDGIRAASVPDHRAGGSRCLRRAGHDVVRGAGDCAGRGQGREGRCREGLRRPADGGAGACRRPDALRDRVEHQGFHRGCARPARGGAKDRVGRAGHHLPAVVPPVGSVRHARAHGSRPAGSSQRPGARCWRPALVAAFDVQPRRNRAPSEGHSARHELPKRLRLRQRALSHRRRGDRGHQRAVVGGFRQHADPEEGRDGRQQRPPFGGRRRRERRGAARAARRQGRACETVRLRQHESRRRHQLERRRHGEMDVGAPLEGAARQRLASLLRTDLPAADDARDADERAAGAARAGARASPTSSATRSA